MQPFGPPGYGRRHGRERHAEQIGESQPIQGRRAKTHRSNFREGGGNVLQGLVLFATKLETADTSEVTVLNNHAPSPYLVVG